MRVEPVTHEQLENGLDVVVVEDRRVGDHSKGVALHILGELLGGSATTSVLERELNFKERVALSAWAGYTGMMRDYGLFVIGVVPVDGVSL